MKVFFLILVIFIISITPIFSQISIGIMGGISDYDYWGSEMWPLEESGINNAITPSFSAGIFIEILIGNRFAFQPEIKYSNARYRMSDGSDWTDHVWNYLVIPLYGKLLIPVGRWNIFMMVGPECHILIDDIKLEHSDGSTNSAQTDNNVIFGFAIASGLEIDMYSGALLLGVNYSVTLTTYADNFEMFSKDLGLQIGYKF